MVSQDCFIELQWVDTYSELVWLAHNYHVADPLCCLCDPCNNSHVLKLFNFVLKFSFHWYWYSSWVVLDWFYLRVLLVLSRKQRGGGIPDDIEMDLFLNAIGC